MGLAGAQLQGAVGTGRQAEPHRLPAVSLKQGLGKSGHSRQICERDAWPCPSPVLCSALALTAS